MQTTGNFNKTFKLAGQTKKSAHSRIPSLNQTELFMKGSVK